MNRDSPQAAEARKFILDIPAGTPSAYVHALHIGGKEKTVIAGIICHAPLGIGDGLEPLWDIISSGFSPAEVDKEKAEKFWEWISDPDTSPWRAIFKEDIELVRDKNGLIKGWIIYNPTLPPFFLKNFAILTRTIIEKRSCLLLWYELVTQHKVDPRDAFYLVTTTQKYGHQFMNHSNNVMGSHWPLTDTGTFNWEAYWTGVFNITRTPSGISVNRGFALVGHQTQNYKPFSVVERYSYEATQPTETVNGRFTRTKVTAVDAVLKSFYEWKRKYVDQRYQTS